MRRDDISLEYSLLNEAGCAAFTEKPRYTTPPVIFDQIANSCCCYLSYLSENVIFSFPSAGALQLNQESEAAMDAVSHLITFKLHLFHFLFLCDSVSVPCLVNDELKHTHTHCPEGQETIRDID